MTNDPEILKEIQADWQARKDALISELYNSRAVLPLGGAVEKPEGKDDAPPWMLPKVDRAAVDVLLKELPRKPESDRVDDLVEGLGKLAADQFLAERGYLLPVEKMRLDTIAGLNQLLKSAPATMKSLSPENKTVSDLCQSALREFKQATWRAEICRAYLEAQAPRFSAFTGGKARKSLTDSPAWAPIFAHLVNFFMCHGIKRQPACDRAAKLLKLFYPATFGEDVAVLAKRVLSRLDSKQEYDKLGRDHPNFPSNN